MTFHQATPVEIKREIVEKALAHVANGLSLTSFCEAEKLNYSTVWGWIADEKGDGSALAHARVVGTNALADKCLDELNRTTAKNVNVVKTKVDGYLRLAGKWNRKDFGDGPQIAIQNNQSFDFSGLSAEAYAEVKATMLAQLPAPNGDT